MTWLYRRFVDDVVLWHGSTRLLGLMRIGLALIIWSRWAPLLSPWADGRPSHVALGVAMLSGSLLMFAGLWTRWVVPFVAATLLVQFYGFGVYLREPGWDGHHTYLLVLMTALLATTPSGRSYSVDRLLAVRRARRDGLPEPEERGDLWGVRLFGLLVALVYFWSAYDKSHSGFLSGDRLEMIAAHYYFGAEPQAPWLHPVLQVLAVTTVVLEYLLAFGLFVRRWHWWLMPIGLTLHVAFYWLLPVSTFTVEMALLYLVFLDPDQAHRLLDEIHGPNAAQAPADRAAEAERIAS